MIELLDVLNNDSNIVYKRCGEVVVAPERNVFALYCIFCQDIFVHAQEFFRHARRLHDDELEFENNEEHDTDVYTIEELMNGMSNNDIIAQEELEWSRREPVEYISENRVLYLKRGIENTDELIGMEYSEDDGNSFVLDKVDNCYSQKIVQSKEENVFASNEPVSKKHTQEKISSYEEEDNPGLDDLLNELDDDLDFIDISIIKKLRHKRTKSIPETETISEQICNLTGETDLFSQINESAKNILGNNVQTNFETTEVSKISSRHSQDSLDELELRSKSLKTKAILEPQYKKLEETTHSSFPILPKSEYCNSPVDAAEATKKTFLEINDELYKSSKKNILEGIFNKAFTDVKKADGEGNIIKKEQNCTSMMYENNEFLKKNYVLMKQIGITKFEKTNKKENIREAITTTSIQEKDIILNKTTLTDEKQYNKMLKVRIKKLSPTLSTVDSPQEKLLETSIQRKGILNETTLSDENQYNKMPKVRIKKMSPPVSTVESPELNQNKANELISRRLLKKKQCSSIKLSPIEKKSAGNKFAAAKTDEVIMETDSPIKNVFFKQNFTEQSIKDKVLKRKNSPMEPQAQTIQSKGKPFSIFRQRKASIDIVQQTPLNKNYLDQSRTARKKQVLDRMSQIRKRITKIIDKENKVVLQPEKNKNNIQITNVAILPTIESVKTKYHPSPVHFDGFVKPKIKVKERNSKTPTFNNVIKNKNSLDKPLKVDISLSNQMHKNKDAVCSELTELDLSESVLEFLQDDLCHNKIDINQFDSILETAPIKAECNSDANLSTQNKDSSSCTLILEDLLNQVEKEKMAMEFATISNTTINEESSHNFNKENLNVTKCGKLNAEKDCLDGYKTTHEEIKLLSQVGLTILKTQYEILPIQEEELLRFKAKQFSDILRNIPSVWQPRRLKDMHTKQLDSSFFEMTAKINSAFKINLTSIEAKRIYNLVMSWYTKQSNRKLLDKKAVSANLQYYMQLFSFLPKTGRPIYNCEFCDQQYRSEVAYSIHRCTHTGGLAYNCFHCGKGFMKSSSHKIHERSHIEKEDANKNQKAIEIENNAYLKASPKLCLENNKRSQKRFHSPENATENINSKRFQADKAKRDLCSIQVQNSNELHSNKMKIPPKRKFECKLCKKVLPTGKDMSNHMNKHVLNTK